MSILSHLSKDSLIHFIGIGGIGMSGIAEILHNMGYQLQGSNLGSNGNTERLESFGIKIFEDHQPYNSKGVSLVVKSTAIHDTNPEIVYCQENDIPIISRSEMLGELMSFKTSIAVSGTHGKTTTTSLIAALFNKAEMNPTVINGGIINDRGTNAYIGTGEYLIAEADESDATFIKVPSKIAVITNIDPEHLDFYGSYENLKESFRTFLRNLPVYGFGVLCIDHGEVRKLSTEITERKIITYGVESEDADVYAHNIRTSAGGSIFDIKISQKLSAEYQEIQNVTLNIPGMHNIQNALAALVIGINLGFNKEVIAQGLSDFQGVQRRFTKIATHNGVTIIDDYAHHPTEVKATLQTARQSVKDTSGKINVIFQPHKYSRLQSFLDDFAESFRTADNVFIADVYPAGENPIEGIDKYALVSSIKSKGFKGNVSPLQSPNEAIDILEKICHPNDLLLFLGAGDVTKWANELPEKIKQNGK
jgi:UDP-N-acetylmuramate--alanine ligase